MDTGELRELLTLEALVLLDSLPPYSSQHDVLRMVSDLRSAGHPPERVAAVLTQAKLRARASAKFGEFAEKLLYTEAGLEQATRLAVAAGHAGRFVRAGIMRVADLGCGLGADALAMSALGITVTAVEADEVTAALAAYNLAAFPQSQVVHADATTVSLTDIEGVYLDPARRTAGHGNTQRLTNSDDYTPSLEFAFGLAERLPTGIKLGPGFDREAIPPAVEAQWISVGGDVVELGLWSGPLAREGIRRSALLLTTAGSFELTADDDSEDAPLGDLGQYLLEPDGAVIRARLIGDLAREIGAHMLDHHIAYMSCDELAFTPFASTFRVLEVLPLDAKAISRELVARGVGILEIKKRGVDIDPAQFRKKLKLHGSTSATLVLTRLGERRVAIVAERVLNPSATER
jgi:hypothetical protein